MKKVIVSSGENCSLYHWAVTELGGTSRSVKHFHEE